MIIWPNTVVHTHSIPHVTIRRKSFRIIDLGTLDFLICPYFWLTVRMTRNPARLGTTNFVTKLFMNSITIFT